MILTKTLLFSGLLTVLFACNADNLIVGDGFGYDGGGQSVPSDTGGSLGAGGAAATGGVESAGGAVETGGVVASGGVTGTGGVVETGGAGAMGGDTAAGGSLATGGVISTGGDLGAGGVVATPGTGGESGSAGSGGSPVPPVPSGNVVTFVNGTAQGAMVGEGWIALGTSETVTTPTCLGGVPITNATPCVTQTVWNNPGALCVSGLIPALPAAPTASDYANNWGIQVGASVGGGNLVLGQSFATITLTVTGTPLQGLRAEVHRQGDPDTQWYCATIQPGVKVSLTAFNTACWDGSGMNLTAADVRRIDKLSVQVSSGSSAITLANLCLSRITFGN